MKVIAFLKRERWVILLIGLVMALALPMLTFPLGRDQGEFATIGRGLLQGKAPYIDLWNPKPPAVFYVYAAAMSVFGRTVPALRAIDLLMTPFILMSIYYIGKRIESQQVGLWATLLLGVFYFTETFWTLTQNDGIVLLPMLLAVVCALKASEQGKTSTLWAFAAGMLCGWIIWFKYPFAVFVGVVALMYGLYVRRINWRDWLACVGGGLLVIGGGIILLMGMGAWEALLESATVTSQYTALGLNLGDFVEAMQVALGFRWSHWGLLFILCAVGIYASLRLKERPAKRGFLGVGVWLLLALGIMLVQAKGYDYHWLPMLPPLVLFGSKGVTYITDGLKRWQFPVANIFQAGLGFLLVIVLFNAVWLKAWPYLTGQEDQLAYFDRFQAGEVIAGESLRVAQYLRERNVPSDSLYIWGFRPEIYYMADLNPPTRFIFQFPLVADWYPEAWREENVEILWAALPPYTLVLQADYMPWVTGSELDSNALLQDYTELNDWLIYNYERDTQIGNFFLWYRMP